MYAFFEQLMRIKDYKRVHMMCKARRFFMSMESFKLQSLTKRNQLMFYLALAATMLGLLAKLVKHASAWTPIILTASLAVLIGLFLYERKTVAFKPIFPYATIVLIGTVISIMTINEGYSSVGSFTLAFFVYILSMLHMEKKLFFTGFAVSVGMMIVCVYRWSPRSEVMEFLPNFSIAYILISITLYLQIRQSEKALHNSEHLFAEQQLLNTEMAQTAVLLNINKMICCNLYSKFTKVQRCSRRIWKMSCR